MDCFIDFLVKLHGSHRRHPKLISASVEDISSVRQILITSLCCRLIESQLRTFVLAVNTCRSCFTFQNIYLFMIVSPSAARFYSVLINFLQLVEHYLARLHLLYIQMQSYSVNTKVHNLHLFI